MWQDSLTQSPYFLSVPAEKTSRVPPYRLRRHGMARPEVAGERPTGQSKSNFYDTDRGRGAWILYPHRSPDAVLASARAFS
jgi:hypothetical protein